MQTITTIGLDIAKSVFQVHGIDVEGTKVQPPGARPGADGSLHTSLLLVLVKQEGSWWIAAYHNVQAAVRYESTVKV